MHSCQVGLHISLPCRFIATLRTLIGIIFRASLHRDIMRKIVTKSDFPAPDALLFRSPISLWLCALLILNIVERFILLDAETLPMKQGFTTRLIRVDKWHQHAEYSCSAGMTSRTWFT